MIIKAKEVKAKVKEAGKQINKGGLEILNREVEKYITALIAKQEVKRITDKTIIL